MDVTDEDFAGARGVVPASWFGGDVHRPAEDYPHLMGVMLPLSADEMAGALYLDRQHLTARDMMDTDDDIWGYIAVTVVRRGLVAFADAVSEVWDQEGRGTLDDLLWLDFCRWRVARITGPHPEGGAPDAE